ncbi:hypothetical protein I0E51_06240 [Pseudomonas lalucatii]|nr:hypothetical protein [Pseudomonas lalucatii]
MPPLEVKQLGGDVLIWGGWRTVAGYMAPGVNAVEIRCNRERQACTEAVASILHHDEGEDLEAQVFAYQVTSWTAERVQAQASIAVGHCLDRHLVIDLTTHGAALEWSPPAGCEGDVGRAVLVGDPILPN